MPVAPRQRLFELGARLWPYGSGLALATFMAFAERETWTSASERPYTPSIFEWLGSRFAAPIQHLNHEPGLAALLLAILVPAVLLHVVWPKWWLAPVTIAGVLGWAIWGSVALGRVGVQAVG
jgi:hypothetical protein